MLFTIGRTSISVARTRLAHCPRLHSAEWSPFLRKRMPESRQVRRMTQAMPQPRQKRLISSQAPLTWGSASLALVLESFAIANDDGMSLRPDRRGGPACRLSGGTDNAQFQRPREHQGQSRVYRLSKKRGRVFGRGSEHVLALRRQCPSDATTGDVSDRTARKPLASGSCGVWKERPPARIVVGDGVPARHWRGCPRPPAASRRSRARADRRAPRRGDTGWSRGRRLLRG